MGSWDRNQKTMFLSTEKCFQKPSWRPQADIYRTTDGWAVKVDIAGVAPEEVKVTLKGRQVTVFGKRSDKMAEHGMQQYQLEIEYSPFERTIELPNTIERARIRKKYQHGMLLVFLETEG